MTFCHVISFVLYVIVCFKSSIIHPCVSIAPPPPPLPAVDDGGDGDEGAVGGDQGGQEERGQSHQGRQKQEWWHEIQLMGKFHYLLFVHFRVQSVKPLLR